MKRRRKTMLVLLSAVVLAASFPLGVAVGEYYSLDNRVRRAAYHYVEDYYSFDNPADREDLVPWTEGIVSEVDQPFRPGMTMTLSGKYGRVTLTEFPPMYQVLFDDPPHSGTLGPVCVWVLKEDLSFIGFVPRE
ncbi:MAG TPA: hypothetical protein IAB55_07595 [Candidatus Merdivicinus faecavium]|nr:hypothetical protein [Candidatus Merdivicinus faecavium]